MTDRQRKMILARELSDDVIAARLGVTRRSVMRFMERLSMASSLLPASVRAFLCLHGRPVDSGGQSRRPS